MRYGSLRLLQWIRHPFSCLSTITSGSSFFKQPCLSQDNKWKTQQHILELRIPKKPLPKSPQLAWISVQGFERRGVQENITTCSLSHDQIIPIHELNLRTLNYLKTTTKKPIEIYFITILEAESPRGRYQQNWCLMRALPLGTGGLCVHVISSSAFTDLSPFSSFYKASNPNRVGPHQYDLI